MVECGSFGLCTCQLLYMGLKPLFLLLRVFVSFVLQSRSLSGNQAEKVVFNGSPSEYYGPLSAKPGLFSAGEPASASEGSSGVVAGTVLRRWNGNGGGRRRGPVSQVAGTVSTGKVACPVSGGTAQTFPGFETDLRDVDATQFGGSAPVVETDLDYVQCVHAPRDAAAQLCSAVVVPSRPPGLVGSFDVGGGHELPAAENTLSGTQFCGPGALLPGPFCLAGSAGARTGHARHPPRDAVVAQRHHSGGGQRHGRRAGSGAAAGFGQQARYERAEAGSCLDSDALLSVRVENPSARVARVNTALHPNSYSTPARSLHDVHVARCVQKSMNSLGDGVVRERGFCVPGGTKSLSMCTRTGVRRPAVEKLASPQQAPLKLHEEMWAGLLKNQGLKISQEVEIVPGCAVRVACPSCPDYYPEPPGPGIVIRNMLGWSLSEKTESWGKQKGLGYGCSGVPSKERIFSLSLTQQETGKGRGRTTQRGRSPVIPHALVRMRMGKAPLSGHFLENGAGHC